MFSHEARHILAAAILAVGTLLAGPLCRAADDVRQVTTEKLPNVPGKSITAIVVKIITADTRFQTGEVTPVPQARHG